MRFETLEQVLSHRFVGNDAIDNEAFLEIDKFVRRDDVPMEQKIEAIYHMSKNGMGVDQRMTPQDVQEAYFD